MRFFFACLFNLRNGCSANCATGSLIFENVLQFDLQKHFNQTAVVKNATKHTHTRTHRYRQIKTKPDKNDFLISTSRKRKIVVKCADTL